MDIQQHIAAIREKAEALKGQQVIVTTTRGQQIEGELWEVRQASLTVGVSGRFAYGGVEDVTPL